MSARELVVAHFEEDLSWLPEKNVAPVRIYHKGGVFHRSDVEYTRLDNVGREAHSCLYHICNHYNSLADVTLFCQGRNGDHSLGRPVEQLFEIKPQHEIAGFYIASQLREWDVCGRMQHSGKWAKMAVDGQMRMSRWPFTAWWKEFLGEDIYRGPGLTYFPGAIFAVRKEAILRVPLEMYKRLLGTVSDHVNPEEAYYLERAWLYLWKIPMAKIAILST